MNSASSSAFASWCLTLIPSCCGWPFPLPFLLGAGIVSIPVSDDVICEGTGDSNDVFETAPWCSSLLIGEGDGGALVVSGACLLLAAGADVVVPQVDNDGEVAGACTPLTPRVATAAGAAASFGGR